MADQAEVRKKAKYAELATTHHFIPLANKITRVFRLEYRGFARAQPLDQEGVRSVPSPQVPPTSVVVITIYK